MNGPELLVHPVFEGVFWNQRVWRFARARKDVLIDWGAGVSDAEWGSSAWQHLIELGKRLILARLDGAAEKAIDPLTLTSERAPLLYFLRWMLRNDYWDMSEVSPQACQYFCDDVFEEKVKDCDYEDQIVNSTLGRYLNVPVLFFAHTHVFANFPEMQPSGHPYGGESPEDAATRLLKKVVKRIPRVPVEVQNCVLPEARRWVCDLSGDILTLQDRFLDARNLTAHVTSHSYSYHTDKVLLSYRFDLSGNLAEPWRPSISQRQTTRRSVHGQFVEKSAGPTSQFKFLLTDLRDASVIMLLGLGGMRISDLGEFQVYPRGSDGLPYCLVKRRSPTGLFDLFFARGRVAKGGDEDDEPDQEWLLGSHPLGSNSLPDAVQALLVLDRLFEPWRVLSESSKLVVSLGKGKGPPRQKPDQADVQLDTLRVGQIDFVVNHVELPQEFADWTLSSHQWRKAYGEDVVTINPDLIPALQQQFKHISQTITEAAYVGNMPFLNRILADQRENSTADAVFAIIESGSIAAGQTEADMGELSENMGAYLREFPTTREKKNALRRMFSEEGITLWGQQHGDCLFRSGTSLCHRMEHGEFDLNARQPLAKHVSSDLCASCSNLIISRRHRDFWVRKRVEHLRSQAEAEANGDTAFAIICRDRAKTAAAILKRLDDAESRRASGERTK